MPDYRVIVAVRDVTEGDVTDLAQAILDNHGGDFDASRGDFKVSIVVDQGASTYAVDWEPLS